MSSQVVRTERENFVIVGQNAGASKRIRNVLAGLFTHAALFRRVLRGEFDIVQCRDVMMLSPIYAWAARRAGSAFCYWMSFPMEDAYIERGRARLAAGGLGAIPAGGGRIVIGHLARAILFCVSLPRANAVFVQSRQMKVDVVAMGLDPAKVIPVPMGVNVQKYDGAIAPLPHEVYGDHTVVLYVGTLEMARRMEVPGRGVAVAMLRHPGMIFAVIGKHTTAEVERLMAPFRELGVADRVRFFGHMPLADLFSHVRRADVCLAPYPPEPRMLASATPTKTIEYVYLGGNIVANRHPDQEEVLRGVRSGVLTDFTAESFADGIDKALSMPPTPQDIERMAQWVRDHRSYDALAKVVQRVYDEAIEKIRA